MPSLAHFIAAALILGAMHSFGPDHLAAVSVFVSRRPDWKHAAGLGARWGMGHSASILLLGGAVVLSGIRLPERFGPAAERIIGVVLIALGLSALWRARKLHAHAHTHEGGTHWHVHSHAESPAHDHSHGALFGIGMLHGLAGTGVLIAALPLAIEGSKASGLLYLAAFGLGTICSMALFAGVAGHLLTVTTAGRGSFQRAALGIAGVLSVGVGIWWLASGGN